MVGARSLAVRFGAPAFAATLGAALAGAALPAGAPAAAVVPDPATQSVVTKAVDWLKTQQQADGGFEVAGAPGFETRDAVLALAEGAQTGGAWSAVEALTAVQGVTRNGKSALDALDAETTPPVGAGVAAKTIVLVAAPLGLNPAAFDPSGNGNPVDLLAAVDAGAKPDGTYGAFSDTLYAAIAKRVTGGSVPGATLTAIRAAQQANGGWGFAGDPAATDVDPDTTGLAVEALVAGGATSTDPAVRSALAMLAGAQKSTGAFPSPFDDGNPNSTAFAVFAITAAGYDPTASCWRDTSTPSLAGTPYTSPDAYLRGAQTAAGNIASPNDSFGLNTFATTQAVEALGRRWLPVTRAAAAACEVSEPPTTPTTPTTAPATPGETAAPVANVSANGGPANGTVGSGGTFRTGTLARTGAVSGGLLVTGASLCALGAGLVLVARRRDA